MVIGIWIAVHNCHSLKSVPMFSLSRNGLGWESLIICLDVGEKVYVCVSEACLTKAKDSLHLESVVIFSVLITMHLKNNAFPSEGLSADQG